MQSWLVTEWPTCVSGRMVCRRFLELKDLKQEISQGACRGVAWVPELQPSIALLRKRIASLQEQIWCYRSRLSGRTLDAVCLRVCGVSQRLALRRYISLWLRAEQ